MQSENRGDVVISLFNHKYVGRGTNSNEKVVISSRAWTFLSWNGTCHE